jgi:hypothetical protein
MNQDIANQFGITWPRMLAQITFCLAIVVALMLAIRATIVSARTFRGTLAILWILLCWLLPIIGPIAVLVAAKKQVELDRLHTA